MTEVTRMATTSKVQEAVSKINALRRLTRESGFFTTRTQGAILAALQPDEMTAVAEVLAQQKMACGCENAKGCACDCHNTAVKRG